MGERERERERERKERGKERRGNCRYMYKNEKRGGEKKKRVEDVQKKRRKKPTHFEKERKEVESLPESEMGKRASKYYYF